MQVFFFFCQVKVSDIHTEVQSFAHVGESVSTPRKKAATFFLVDFQ